MGGSYYDRSVAENVGNGYSQQAAQALKANELAPECHPKGRSLECKNDTPIVIAMDVTRSRGGDSKILYDKLPMFYGQLLMQGYLADPGISFAAIGDATAKDKAPVQICDFAQGNELDTWIKRLWLEEGGGGSGQESYELTAYYYANHCSLDANLDGKKGFFFFTGDEGFYPKVNKDQIKMWVGDDVNADVDSVEVFKKLQEKFNVYFLYPRKTLDERKADIDAELLARLKREGAKSGDVTISLMWNNVNDLDLHVVPPDSQEIYYGRKQVGTGTLDVDMNASSDNRSDKPVENVFFSGKAPLGNYRVYVKNFGYNCNERTYNFKVSVSLNKKVTVYEGTITPDKQTVEVCTFAYAGADEKKNDDVYEKYDEKGILDQWYAVLPKENVLFLKDPKAIVDTLLGVISIGSGTRTSETYLQDLIKRGQSEERQKQVMETLASAKLSVDALVDKTKALVLEQKKDA